MSIFGWMPNADVNSIVDRELANQDLNSTRDGFADRTGAWNWQDSVGAWMAGTNKEEVLRLATEKANKRLQESLSPRVKEAAAMLGPLQSRYTGVSGKTIEQLDAEIKADERRATALQTELARNPNFNVDSLPPTATAGQILQAGSKATKTENERKAREERDRIQAETLRLEGKEQARYDMEVLREDRRDARDALTRAQEKKDALELRRDNMNLEYARLAQADKYRREDKREKAILALIQGLGNLGAGFTI